MTNVKGIKAEKQNGKLKEYFSSLFRDSMDNYVHRRSRRLDTRLLLLVSALLVVGLFSLASSSYVYAYYHTDNHNSSYYIVQQLIYAAIGAAGMLAASYVPVKYYKQGLKWLYIITIIMLALCYVCKAKNGCHRWLWLGKGPSFQPSELAKFTVIALGAYWGSELYTKKKPYLKNIRKRPKPSRKLSAPDRFFFRIGSFLCNTWELLRNSIFFYLGLVMVIALLIVFETHLSCTIIIMLIALTITFLAGMPWVPLLATMVTAGGAAIALITSGIAAYSSTRIRVWQNPTADLQGEGWQTTQSLYAISNGGIFGRGIFNSTQKYLYVSEPQNDMIFAIVCEEVGMVGAILIIMLFMAFVCRAYIVSVKSPDRFSKLLGLGIASQIAWQTLLNIAVVTNSMPNTGISLPFFSSGGTSLVMLLLEVGVLLAISRPGQEKFNKEGDALR